MSRGEIDILDQKNKVVCKYLSHRTALSFYLTGISVVEFILIVGIFVNTTIESHYK